MLRICIGALLLLGLFVGGCQTLTMDAAQQTNNYSRIADHNRRMLADDINALLLLDQPSGLTPWTVRKRY